MAGVAEIAELEARDPSSPPPTDGIVLVGNSSIKRWTNPAADFCGFPGVTFRAPPGLELHPAGIQRTPRRAGSKLRNQS